MLSLKTFEIKIKKTIIFMTFSGRVKLKRYMNASLMSNGTFFLHHWWGAWSLVLRHDKWIFYSSAWSSDFLMNGRTTKLLLARKKKGVVHKRRPQLGGGGVKNWSKLSTNSTRNLPTWGRNMAFPVVEFSRQGYKIRKVFG